VIVRFVDIGEFVNHHCLIFFFIMKIFITTRIYHYRKTCLNESTVIAITLLLWKRSLKIPKG